MAGREKELGEMLAWARGRVAQSAVVVRAHKAKVAGSHTPRPPPAADHVEFVLGPDGTGLAALGVLVGGSGSSDEDLDEEVFDPLAAFLLDYRGDRGGRDSVVGMGPRWGERKGGVDVQGLAVAEKSGRGLV